MRARAKIIWIAAGAGALLLCLATLFYARQQDLWTVYLIARNAQQRARARALFSGVSCEVDEAAARRLLERCSRSGDPLAQVELAVLRRRLDPSASCKLPPGFADGAWARTIKFVDKGVPEAELAIAQFDYFYLYKSEAPAFSYAQQAAQQGYTPAFFDLSMYYAFGYQTPQDYDKAAEWLQRSAAAGSAEASYQLGFLYGQPDWKQKDFRKAFENFSRAAQAKLPYAYAAVGYCYQTGTGTVKDLQAAIDWFQRGVAIEDGRALSALAASYKLGLGVPVDQAQADALHARALKAGYDDRRTASDKAAK